VAAGNPPLPLGGQPRREEGGADTRLDERDVPRPDGVPPPGSAFRRCGCLAGTVDLSLCVRVQPGGRPERRDRGGGAVHGRQGHYAGPGAGSSPVGVALPFAQAILTLRRDNPLRSESHNSRRGEGSGMDETRKRARTGIEEDVSAPAVKDPQSPQSADAAAAATKIAELQAELEALKQSHNVVVNELNANIDALQAKNESQKREIEGLSSALQWAYAIEEIPQQHWLEQGHSEEYADAMENLLGSMKEIIQTLSLGTVLNDSDHGKKIVKIDFDLQNEDENYIRADHDELLMPYWKELASALRHWSEYHADGQRLQVGIQYIELPKTVLDILRPAFELSRIETFFFENSLHSGDLADFAKKVLQTNHFVTGPCFGRFTFAHEDVKEICGAIKSRNAEGQFVEGLGMGDCFEAGIDTRTLKMILGSITTVSEQDTILRLNDNGMSSREAAVISSILTSNPCLSQLEMDGNRFDDADATGLADALSSNTHLSHISVENNGIKEDGRLAFLRATFDISSLSSCAASNHTCTVDGLERDISAINSYESAPRNKWNKIVTMLALSSEDSFINTSLLRGVPAQLIPVILDKCNLGFANSSKDLTDLYLELTNTTRCQNHDVWDSLEETKSLNCMYNLTRSWASRMVSSEIPTNLTSPGSHGESYETLSGSNALQRRCFRRPDVLASALRGRNRPDRASLASLSSLLDGASTKARRGNAGRRDHDDGVGATSPSSTARFGRQLPCIGPEVRPEHHAAPHGDSPRAGGAVLGLADPSRVAPLVLVGQAPPLALELSG
ncbi:hypothetical protein THAOC_27419, partial [Thalassiosira oceanica]